MTPNTAPTAMTVVRLAISISFFTRAIAAAADGSMGACGAVMAVAAIETVTVPEAGGGRLDRVLAAQVQEHMLSRSRLKALILAGHVTVAGRTVLDPAASVNSGDIITVTLPEPEPATPAAQAMALDIVYERRADRAEQASRPRRASCGGTRQRHARQCADRAMRRQPVRDRRGAPPRNRAPPRQGHDRADGRGQDRPRASPAQHSIRRQARRPDRARLSGLGLGRAGPAARQGGREAVTQWEVVARYIGADGKPVAALLSCRLETGRTHQIRVHLAHIGHPIMGDETYATGFRTKAVRLNPDAQAALAALGRQALHAEHLGFEHPNTGEFLDFHADLPADMARLRNALATP